jgi:hypothetical protein
MRTFFALIFTTVAFAAFAQSTARPRPPGTVPLEEPPPPPPMTEPSKEDPALQPQTTTRTEGDNQIVEYRVRGKLYMVRVTPKHGKSYVMIDHKGDGTFTKQDNTLDNGVRVPQWVLKEF